MLKEVNYFFFGDAEKLAVLVLSVRSQPSMKLALHLVIVAHPFGKNTLKWYRHTSAVKAFKSCGKVGRFTKLHQARHSWIGKNVNHPCLFTHSKISMFVSRLIILRSFLSSEDQRRQDEKQWKEKEPCLATDFENHVAAIQHQNRDQKVSY